MRHEKTELLATDIPHSDDSERAVLGSMLLEWEACKWATDSLGAGDFYSPCHQELFGEMAEAFAEKEHLDATVLVTRLESKGSLARLGGSTYLARLMASAPTAMSVETYGQEVRDKARLRNALTLAETCIRDIRDLGAGDVNELLGKIKERWAALADNTLGKHNWRKLGEVMREEWDVTSAKVEQKDVQAIPTGLIDLDAEIGGLHNSSLHVLAARPREGKTTALLNWLCHAAIRCGHKVAFFSLEMKAGGLAGKVMAAEGPVNSHNLRMGRLSAEDINRACIAVDKTKEVNFWLDDTRALQIDTLCNRARLAVNKLGVQLIGIDYLQLVNVRRAESVRLGVVEITHKLQALAGELNIPIVLLSQVSRSAEARDDKKPTLADLKESGSIEEDADVVLFIHHPGGNHQAGKKNIFVAKNRLGPMGKVVTVYWEPEYQRFRNLVEREKE